MSQEQFKSAAFQNAELKSEHLRIFAVLVFVAIFIIVTTVRVFIVRTAAATTPWMWSYILASVVVGYELWTLHKVNLALRGGASLAARFWILSTILETSVPALAIAFLTSQQVEAAYRPLASPAVLVFFIFIILSTLRLSPWITVLSGMVASITYLCAAWYLGWRIPLPGAEAPVTQTTVTLNAITLLIGGVVAGAVASQIRRHVQAALQEAETKRKLETLEHDLQVARSIQQSLLPQERPQIDGFDIAGWNQPAMILAATFTIGRLCPMENWWSASPMSPATVLGRIARSTVPRIRAKQFRHHQRSSRCFRTHSPGTYI